MLRIFRKSITRILVTQFFDDPNRYCEALFPDGSVAVLTKDELDQWEEATEAQPEPDTLEGCVRDMMMILKEQQTREAATYFRLFKKHLESAHFGHLLR